MCEKCEPAAIGAGLERRRRLWEIDSNWHCSIVGTCLTLGDLRRVARKLGYKPPVDPYYDVDSYLHGYFVKLCGKPTIAAKMLEKVLNRRHAGAIRKLQKVKTVGDLCDAWTAAFSIGDVPGPYWAMLSHPLIDLRLGSKIYNDVHMLSHLVGASNRADLANLRRLESDLAGAQELAEQTRARSVAKIREKDARIEVLEAQVASLSGRLESARKESRNAPPCAIDRDQSGAVVAHLEAQLARMTEQNEILRRDNAAFHILVPSLRDEIQALERALGDPDEAESGQAGCDNFRCDLKDRCLLYVGGRTRHVGQMRNLVSDWNGILLHHDGGLEQSLEELSGAILKADAVFFPTDCVSHKAMYRLKSVCQQTKKPFVPLRTSSLSCFLAGLEKTLKDGGAELTAQEPTPEVTRNYL
jgi:hypothetical protein